MNVRLLIPLILLAGCAQLGMNETIVTSGANYITFEHPYTDAAAEAVRQKAIKHCAQSKAPAIKTQSVCSLSKCTTTYQCVESADAAGK